MISRVDLFILYLSLLACFTAANLVVPYVQPRCDPANFTWSGCLPGQACLADGACVNHPDVHYLHARQTFRPAIGEPTVGQALTATATGSAAQSGPITTDGTCGASFAGTVCGGWPRGSCCSMHGWCGNTTAHCGDGCQSGPCANGSFTEGPGPRSAPTNPNPGSFKVVGQAGVPAMHAALMPNGKVVFLDKVEDYTELQLTSGRFAYSAEYDPSTNQVSPLALATNPFCSGGIFLPDGRLVSLGGNFGLSSIDPSVGNGLQAVRYLQRLANDSSYDGQAWAEPGNTLDSARWYASAQVLPDGNIFVASGSLNGFDPAVAANNNPTYELLDNYGVSQGYSAAFDILVRNQPYYMYPFMHLLSDGSLFVFVAKSAELYNLTTGATKRVYPDLPGGYRTYPNTGGSVILPFSSSNNYNPDVVLCGGGPYQAPDAPTDASCGRINPLASDSSWEMDSMPEGRVMVEGTLLPDGTVIWLNGAGEGAQGFGFASHPAQEALIYDPDQPHGSRFTTGANSSIARMYHSVALLLLDGTILVAGSNPVEQPILQPDAFHWYVTEFRVEIYTPPYLTGDKASRRPTNIALSSDTLKANSSIFGIEFTAPSNAQSVSIVLYYGGFVTHSLHMGHRMIILDNAGWVNGSSSQSLMVAMPPSSNIAPLGPYVIYVLCDGIPGVGQFVSVD